MTDRTHITKKYSPSPSYYRQQYTTDIPMQEYMNQVARVRLLEDQLMSSKIKIDSLERKALEFSDTIYKYEQEILNLQQALERANRQLKIQMSKDCQLEAYEQSLREVGGELAALNQALIKKNNDYNKLTQNTKKVIAETQQLKSELKQYQQIQQQTKNKICTLIKILDEQYDINLNQHTIHTDLKTLQENIINQKTKFLHAKNQLQRFRKEASENTIQQKQKIIKLEYQLKLIQNRAQDQTKKKQMENNFSLDANTQKIIQGMLKKEDQLYHQVQKLEKVNEDLRQQLEIQHQSRMHYQKIKVREMQNDLKAAKVQIKSLITEKDKLQEQLQQYSSYAEHYQSHTENYQAQITKKYRQTLQENKRLQMKILGLVSDKQMLEKQLRLRYSAHKEHNTE